MRFNKNRKNKEKQKQEELKEQKDLQVDNNEMANEAINESVTTIPKSTYKAKFIIEIDDVDEDGYFENQTDLENHIKAMEENLKLYIDKKIDCSVYLVQRMVTFCDKEILDFTINENKCDCKCSEKCISTVDEIDENMEE